jgi:hypothetical protein
MRPALTAGGIRNGEVIRFDGRGTAPGAATALSVRMSPPPPPAAGEICAPQ